MENAICALLRSVFWLSVLLSYVNIVNYGIFDGRSPLILASFHGMPPFVFIRVSYFVIKLSFCAKHYLDCRQLSLAGRGLQICAFDRVISLQHTRCRWILKLWTTKFDRRKLETLLYREVQNVFRYLEPFRRGSQVWRTDRRTDRTTIKQLASCLIYAPVFIEYICGCVLFQDVTVREIRGR